jgi:hypothetical protein
MGLIEAIESSAYAEWVRASPSFFAYTFILSLHAMGLAVVVGLNCVIAFRLLGFVPELPVAPLRKLFPWIYAGFTINAISGGSLLAANLTADLSNWMFLSKLFFILLAMINLELTRTRIFDAPGALSSPELPRQARTFAILSFLFWGLATISGRLTAYPNFVEAILGI